MMKSGALVPFQKKEKKKSGALEYGCISANITNEFFLPCMS